MSSSNFRRLEDVTPAKISSKCALDENRRFFCNFSMRTKKTWKKYHEWTLSSVSRHFCVFRGCRCRLPKKFSRNRQKGNWTTRCFCLKPLLIVRIYICEISSWLHHTTSFHDDRNQLTTFFLLFLMIFLLCLYYVAQKKLKIFLHSLLRLMSHNKYFDERFCLMKFFITFPKNSHTHKKSNLITKSAKNLKSSGNVLFSLCINLNCLVNSLSSKRSELNERRQQQNFWIAWEKSYWHQFRKLFSFKTYNFVSNANAILELLYFE